MSAPLDSTSSDQTNDRDQKEWPDASLLDESRRCSEGSVDDDHYASRLSLLVLSECMSSRDWLHRLLWLLDWKSKGECAG